MENLKEFFYAMSLKEKQKRKKAMVRVLLEDKMDLE